MGGLLRNLLRCHFNIEWKSCHVYVYLLQLIIRTCHIIRFSDWYIGYFFSSPYCHHHLLFLPPLNMCEILYSLNFLLSFIDILQIRYCMFIHSLHILVWMSSSSSSHNKIAVVAIWSAIYIECDNKKLIDTLSHLRLLWMFKYWYSSRSLYNIQWNIISSIIDIYMKLNEPVGGRLDPYHTLPYFID